MPLFIASLNSGSNGNCYYVGNDHEAVLIDAGISCRETEQRMKRLELSMKKVKAIFVSHEHADHIDGVSRLSRKHQLPVYITTPTLLGSRLSLKDNLVRPFRAYEPITLGSLSVTAFPKFHDASDPHSFIVSFDSVNVGIFTDIGRVCNHLIKHFEQCHAAFLESNYDEEMLENGSYTLALKNRIRGGHGHLSNKEALELFINHKAPFLGHLFLSHISENNNTPTIVEKLFSGVAGNTKIIIASRYEETGVQTIHATGSTMGVRPIHEKRIPAPQLSLFQ